MHDVFVSYATPDKQVADAIVHHLESLRIRCFIAPRNILPGTEWRGQLEEGIKTSKVLVLVLSSHSNISEPCRKEIFTAAEAGLNILQFKLQKVDLHPDLAFELRGRHWLDAIDPPLVARIQELGVALKGLLGSGSTAPRGVGPSTADQPQNGHPAHEKFRSFTTGSSYSELDPSVTITRLARISLGLAVIAPVIVFILLWVQYFATLFTMGSRDVVGYMIFAFITLPGIVSYRAVALGRNAMAQAKFVVCSKSTVWIARVGVGLGLTWLLLCAILLLLMIMKWLGIL